MNVLARHLHRATTWPVFLSALMMLAVVSVAGLGLGVVTAGQAGAQTYNFGSIRIEQPWARATPSGSKVGAGFLKITNTGKESDRLLGGTMVQAGKLELHETKLENNVMRMRHLDKGLEIKPGETVELKPGSFHIMFMDLKSGLAQGQQLKGTLVFEKAGTVAIEFKVEAVGSQGGHSHH